MQRSSLLLLENILTYSNPPAGMGGGGGGGSGGGEISSYRLLLNAHDAPPCTLSYAYPVSPCTFRT